MAADLSLCSRCLSSDSFSSSSVGGYYKGILTVPTFFVVVAGFCFGFACACGYSVGTKLLAASPPENDDEH